MRKHKWIKLTIAEAYPVIHRFNAFRGDGDPGPFYAPCSEWFSLYSKREMAYVEQQAVATRARGYTVTVEVVER